MVGVVLPIIVFLGSIIFSVLYNRFAKDPVNRVVSRNVVDGRNQQKVKKLPSVQAYLAYMDSINHKNYRGAWKYLTPEKQRSFGDSTKLRTLYYLTKSHEKIYIILESEKEFFALLDFTDMVNPTDVSVLRSLLQEMHAVSDGIDNIDFQVRHGLVTNQVYDFIQKRFIIEDEKKTKASVDSILRGMTMTRYVEGDWRTPIVIAYLLNLEPKEYPELKTQSNKLLQTVEMEQVGKDWKIKEVKTKAVARWE